MAYYIEASGVNNRSTGMRDTGTEVRFQERVMLVFTFGKRTVCKVIALGVLAGLASSALAQESTPPASQSNAASPQSSTTTPPTKAPPLTPMPQAPAPQHHATSYSDQNYAKPQSGFPNFIAPYTSRRVPPPNLINSSRTDQVFHDGKIYLSINDAVALALENNLDITL